MNPQNFVLTTPILFLIFNRLDTTKKVFAEIRKAKPKKLFIAADGPRKNKKGEKEIVESVRKYVLKNIDWDCKVKTLFKKKNLGCKYAVSGAIDWFFENVEQGIILEDDCLPDQSFFVFCEELLDRYKYNEKIMCISGDNFLKEELMESYCFSKKAQIWGWATWKRSWKKYNIHPNIKDIKETIKNSKLNFLEKKLTIKQLGDALNGRVNTWDYQWQFAIIKNEGLCVIPRVNLVENLGLSGSNFTNTRPNNLDVKYLHHLRRTISFPLKHPEEIEQNKKFDRMITLLNLKRIILKRMFGK